MQKFQANPYLTNRIKEADDKKYHLTKTIYEINDITYEKGSRTVDYTLRDLVDALRDGMDEYYNTIKLFEVGQAGHVDMMDEILAFFESNRFDSFVVRDRLAQLKSEIEKTRNIDKELSAKAPESAFERRVNLYLDELEYKIKIFESQLIISIIPGLNDFLTAVSEIRLGFFIHGMIKGSMGGDKLEAGERNSFLLKPALVEFLRFNTKLTRKKRSEDDYINLVNDILNLMDVQEDLVTVCGIGKVKKGRVILDAVQELLSMAPQYPESAPSRPAAAAPETRLSGSASPSRRLSAFLNDLVNLNLNEVSNQVSSDPEATQLAKNRGRAFVFHEPGSAGITLKVVADYLIDSLIFVITWIVRELKKQALPLAEANPLVESLYHAENFLRDFKLALAVTANRSNQATLLGGRIQSLVPKEFAVNFARLILSVVEEIHDGFIHAHFNVGASSAPGSETILKRIEIAQESFTSARKRIIKGIGDLKLGK